MRINNIITRAVACLSGERSGGRDEEEEEEENSEGAREEDRGRERGRKRRGIARPGGECKRMKGIKARTGTGKGLE